MTSSDSHDEPKRLGDFEIIRELGRGGMGVVYEARQRSLNRHVALKVLSTGLGLTTKAVMRFKREAEAAAKLHHTNIVPIYFTGDEGRVPYYAMELVDGPSLDHVIRQLRSGSDVTPNGSLDSTDDASPGQQSAVPDWVNATIGLENPSSGSEGNASTSVNSDSSSSFGSGSTYFDNVASMMSGVADALAHAHDQGVIHRDIKPSNLLLSQDGRLSVNDFGLARMLEQPGMTVSGELMGSPMYMSPEQIAVGRIPLDHRTDIYSLGAALYELITLRPPFEGKQRDQVLSQIIHKEPAPPRTVKKQIPKDLETICLKAMEKDPDRRYQTADMMAEDLRHFVDRHAISARRIGPMERAGRWARKNKALTAMACMTLIVIVSASANVYVSNRKHQRKEAEERALIAALSGKPVEAVAEINKAQVYGAETWWANMLLGQLDMFEGKSKDALAKFEDAVKEKPKSVMAHSMLATSYLYNGLQYKYATALDDIENLPVRNAEDHLFKGIAFSHAVPEVGMQSIEKAIELRSDFTLAKIARATASIELARDQGNVGHVLEAIKEMDYLSRDLEANPMLINRRLLARLTAYHLYRRNDEMDKADDYLRQAKQDVDYLANFPRFFGGNLWRLYYYYFDSDLDRMREVMQDVLKSGNQGYIVTPYCAACFARGGERIPEAVKLLEQMEDQGDAFVFSARFFLLMGSPSGREQAKKELEKQIERYPNDALATHDYSNFYFLLGETEKAVEYAKAHKKNMAVAKYFSINGDKLDYWRGDITEAQLIARAGKSERSLGAVHGPIAIRHLAHGNREAAMQHFEKSARCAAFSHYWPTWSMAFLARMDKDPNWPDWLPAEPVDLEEK